MDNIARGRPAWQSSTLKYDLISFPAEYAVDGNQSIPEGIATSCSHTKEEMAPFWAVDLGFIAVINEIVIYPRKDCCGECSVFMRFVPDDFNT